MLSSSVIINLFFPMANGRKTPTLLLPDSHRLSLAAWSISDCFNIPPASLTANHWGHPEVTTGQEASRSGPATAGINRLTGLLPSPIFWSVTFWKESVSSAVGRGRQERMTRGEGGEEIGAGFFPGRKIVCPRTYPKHKLNIPLSTIKLPWMGGCATSWQAV